MSTLFWNHDDGSRWTFRDADAASLAVIEIELKALAGPEFDHGIVRADPEAVVAFKTISTRHATARLVKSRRFIESLNHFLKVGGSSGAF